MKFSPYPRYKDSGIDWLGEIPEHWEQLRLSWLFRRNKTTNRPDAELLSIYRDYGVIPKSSRDDNFNKPSDDLSTYQLVEVGDLVLNKMKTWQGSIAISEFEGIVSPAYFVAKPRREFNLRYVHYLLRSPVYISQYLRYSKGIRPNQWDLDFDDFRVITAILPPIEEQKAIAEFLDVETLRIDELISKQEQLITLLQEKRQALISIAVIKGLNSNAPCKDSGVDGLGEIPEHWEAKRLKHLLKDILMYGANEASETEDTNLPRFIRITDINDDGTLRKDTFKALPFEIAEPYLLKDGDVLLARSGATVGKSIIYNSSWGTACFAGYLIRARLNRKKMETRFFGYFSQSNSYWEYILGSQIQSTIQNVSAEKYANLWLSVPPLTEQKEIVGHLDLETAEIDALIKKARQAIKLLQEHRTSLISSAVTGKIDVRRNLDGNLSNH